MHSIQTIVFDFGGVILDLKPEIEWFQQDILAHFENDKLLKLYQQQYFQNFEKGKIEVSDFLRQLQEITIHKNITETEIKRHWNAILKSIPAHRVEIIRQLKSKYQLILLSNTNAIHVEQFRNDMMEHFGEDVLDTHFDIVYYSQEIGMRKPHQEIYEFVQNQHQLLPSTILFLDDKAENLIEPQKLGWHTMHVHFNKLSINDLQHLI